MTIGGSTGLGSDLARVQQESFNSIVNQDCKRIANAMTNSVVNKVCGKLGLGDVKCKFVFMEDDEYTADNYLDMANKLMTLGIKVDASELKKITKLTFIDDSETEWTPTKDENKEWTPEEKAQLKKELEEEDNK